MRCREVKSGRSKWWSLSQGASWSLLGSGDAVRNKRHPKWTHTGNTPPNTTWPNRIHLGLHVCKLISSLFFVSLYSVCSWIPTIMLCLPVPVQLTWLQPQDSPCIRASYSHPVWTCLGIPTSSWSWTQSAAPTAPCLFLSGSSGLSPSTFLEVGCINFKVFFYFYIPISVSDSPMSFVYKKVTVDHF